MGLGGGSQSSTSATVSSTSSQPPVKDRKRNSAPTGPTQLFASANVARARRSLVGAGSSALSTLEENSYSSSANASGASGVGHGNTSFVMSEEEDSDVGDSPCPPPTKGMGVGMKGKKMPALGVPVGARKVAPLARAETYGGRFGAQF